MIRELIERGGPVMWPLLAMSLLAVTLVIERAWFWIRTNRPARLARVTETARLFRLGDARQAISLTRDSADIYSQAVRALTTDNHQPTESQAVEAIDRLRPQLERFMSTLSTIITAAPMLGILGTVFGIIASFQALSVQASASDPRLVGQGIAEALLTTAAGLIIAIMVLFPYNAFRTQLDRTLGRMETLAGAAVEQTSVPNKHAPDTDHSSHFEPSVRITSSRPEELPKMTTAKDR